MSDSSIPQPKCAPESVEVGEQGGGGLRVMLLVHFHVPLCRSHFYFGRGKHKQLKQCPYST